MRKLQYGVAVSVDGFIAGPQGQSDWIQMDPEIDFAAIWSSFDTLLMGRRTYEAATRRLGAQAFAGKTTLVVSRTLDPNDHPNITIVSELTRPWLQSLKNQPGKDIWLMGGGDLFRNLLALHEVDTIDITTIPVLLGDGTPLMSPPYFPINLTLLNHRAYKSGTTSATYAIVPSRHP
jgi:dihydrofolate reductase